ncbi:protoporphyrinogen oxidase [Terrimesophilobacter mesophilus]|uniref:Protoporphyrinogen oxidase n=1 Tax=Terrimesophilobacter mesophilus TaxID=433647 RepID=A0A4R8VG38_9MICO|nr:protoporphyrinogen oxidase [Terrimesophilobacter mesophilus]
MIGGGIAGLVVARDLAVGGVPVMLLEADDRLGGQVRRHRVGGIDLDAGAEAFAIRTSAVADLAEELGLRADIVAPQPAGAWLYSDDRGALPLPATSLLGIPATPFDAAVARIVGRRAALRAGLDAVLPRRVGATSRTLGELVRRRMGTATVEGLVAPVTVGVHSTHPDELPLERVAPGLLAALAAQGTLARAVRRLRGSAIAGSAVAGIRGGITRLVDELRADLERRGADIRVGARVDEVWADGALVGGQSVPGAVVVAAPGLVAPAQSRRTVLATLVLDSVELDSAPRGSGVLVARSSRVMAKALTHQTAKWSWLAERAAGRHVVRLSYASAPPDFSEVARADAAELLGIDIRPGQVLDFATVEWSRAVRQPPVPGVVQVGESVAGTGLASVVAQARAQAASLLSGPLAPPHGRPLGRGASTKPKSRSVVPGKENDTE